MQGDEFPAKAGEIVEEVEAAGQRQSRKVDFEEFGVAISVARAVENGINVVERSSGVRSVPLTSIAFQAAVRNDGVKLVRSLGWLRKGALSNT